MTFCYNVMKRPFAKPVLTATLTALWPAGPWALLNCRDKQSTETHLPELHTCQQMVYQMNQP